jgi:hypothetical protein
MSSRFLTLAAGGHRHPFTALAASLAAAAGLALAAPAAAQSRPPATGAPDASATAADATRWSRCVTLGRSVTNVAQTQDWDGMEALAQQQLSECGWNAEMRLDAIENLADVSVMRGDAAGAIQYTDRCLAEKAQRTGCLITRAFVLAQLQQVSEARGAIRSAQEALGREAGEYERRSAALSAAAGAGAPGNAATPLGAAALAAGAIPTGGAEELRAVQLQSVEDYRVKLTHYSGVISEMSRAMGMQAR